MEAKSNKIRIGVVVFIGVAVVTGLAVGGFFLADYLKKQKATPAPDDTPKPNPETPANPNEPAPNPQAEAEDFTKYKFASNRWKNYKYPAGIKEGQKITIKSGKSATRLDQSLAGQGSVVPSKLVNFTLGYAWGSAGNGTRVIVRADASKEYPFYQVKLEDILK